MWSGLHGHPVADMATGDRGRRPSSWSAPHQREHNSCDKKNDWRQQTDSEHQRGKSARRTQHDTFAQDLQGHLPVQLRVGGLIHLPYAAFADLGGDRIGPEGGCTGSSGIGLQPSRLLTSRLPVVERLNEAWTVVFLSRVTAQSSK